MKNLITRIAITFGAAALSPAAALAQETGSYSIKEVCSNPELSSLSQKLWDYVAKQDKVEVYIAYLDACGDSPLTAEFASQAREVVIQRTSNYSVMPSDTYTFSQISERRVNAYYVG